MIKNRKGLSEIVTTVLIILLVIIAILAIWAFVRPSITQAGAGIGEVTGCFANEIGATKCQISTTSSSGQWTAIVTPKRILGNGGTGSYTVIVTSDGGQTKVLGPVPFTNTDALASQGGTAITTASVNTGASTSPTYKPVSAYISTTFNIGGQAFTCDSAPITCA